MAVKNQFISDVHSAHFIQERITKEKSFASNFFPNYIRVFSKGINLLHKLSPHLSSRITLKFLSIALRRKLSKLDISFYNDGLKEQYKVANYKFYTYTYGNNGPVLLLLHGLCSNAARWRNYIPQLIDAGYQVVALDCPGHGTSPGYFMSVPIYIKCVKKVLESRPHWDGVVAHSMGGLVSAIALGDLKYIQPSKYVLLNSFNTGDCMMSTFARSLGISENVISDIRIRIEQNTGRPLKDYSFSTHLNENNKHGLIMHDLNDIIVPVSEAKKNKAYFKNFKFLLTKGLGHNMFSRDVEKTVVDFLKEKGESETNPNYNRLVK